MPALRLMTFNVHLPSAPMAIVQGLDDTAVADAHTIATAILNIPIRDRPDVIVFNEVFHNGARTVLRQDLVLWPHVMSGLGEPVPPPLEDSALMVFSRLPFVPFAPGVAVQFEAYEAAAGTDAGARKGIAIVRIDTPIQPTTIALTHMQASYDAANTEHQDIRRKQFDEIMQFLKSRLGPNPTEWHNVVLVGDLNVKGDPDAITSEWNEIFNSPQVEFGQVFSDGWREHMHPPSALDERDPGYTNRADGGMLNRLDYQCFKRINPQVRQLVPHHLSTPLRHLSDHWSLLSRIQLFKPATTPATAVNLLVLPPLPASVPGIAQSPFRIADLTIGDPGAYQWLYVSKPGTFSVFVPPAVEIAAYSEDDLTHALAEAAVLAAAEVGVDFETLLKRRGLVPKGPIFASRTPFFIRVRSKDEAFTGACPVGVLEHRGDKKETAIILLPYLEVDPQLPQGQKLGDNDVCWFRADVPAKYDEQPYVSAFMLRNPASVAATVTLLNEAEQEVGPPAAASTSVIRKEEKLYAMTFYVTLKRTALADTKFTMEWQTLLSFLRLDMPMELKIEDETGPDWPGADELRFGLGADDEPILVDTWDDADTGEVWPQLGKKVRDAVILKMKPVAADIAFDKGLGLDVLKTDGLSAHGSAGGFVRPLDQYDKDLEERIVPITIQDTFGDGHVTFTCVIARFPSGKKT